MIRRVQALGYRCLRHADVRLGEFQVLVGPNASGKSTLLDAIVFLRDLVSDGMEGAVGRRTKNFQDLVWRRPGQDPGFELAIEVRIPESLRAQLPAENRFETFRYEVAIRESDGSPRIASERATLEPQRPPREAPPPEIFPAPVKAPTSILLGGGRRGARTILSKSANGNDSFHFETSARPGKGWVAGLALGDRRSTLANLPEAPDRFPVATHVKRLLTGSVVPVFLNSVGMRRATPPDSKNGALAADGTNLPWLVERLRWTDRPSFDEWLGHVGTALPDLEDLRVVERPDDRHAYLMLRYRNGVTAPSWTASDGTLRLLALTLPAYLDARDRVYLFEEPENGIHPLAVECIFQSLHSIYDSQVLLSTHSSLVLHDAKPEQVLVFAKDPEGATDIVRGSDHPLMRDWLDAPYLDALFSAGVQ